MRAQAGIVRFGSLDESQLGVQPTDDGVVDGLDQHLHVLLKEIVGRETCCQRRGPEGDGAVCGSRFVAERRRWPTKDPEA